MAEISQEVRAELGRCEDALLWPDASVSAIQLEALLAAQFHEIGASGRRLDRQFGQWEAVFHQETLCAD